MTFKCRLFGLGVRFPTPPPMRPSKNGSSIYYLLTIKNKVNMKKLVFALVAFATIAIASCGVSTTSAPATIDTTARVAMVDTAKKVETVNTVTVTSVTVTSDTAKKIK